MKSQFYKGIVVMLAFIVFFSTVAPVYVFSFDADYNTEFVVNLVQTSSNTGGQSGIAGKNGKDGQNGQKGRDGVSVINSKSNASIFVETNINGKKVVDINESQVSDDGALTVTDIFSTSTIPDFNTNSSDVVFDEKIVNNFQQVLSSIRLILLTYVSTIF